MSAVPDDPLLDAVMRIMDASFDPAWGEAWNRRQVASSLGMPSTHVALIAAGGAVPDLPASAAGFAMSRSAPGEEELLLIAVEPQYRRTGLAGRLLATLAEDARERGAERLFLEMRENNPAVELYSTVGFEPIGQRKAYYRLPDGTRLDAITFALDL